MCPSSLGSIALPHLINMSSAFWNVMLEYTSQKKKKMVCIHPVVRRQISIAVPLHPSAPLIILFPRRFIILLVILLVSLLLEGQEPFHFYVARDPIFQLENIVKEQWPASQGSATQQFPFMGC